MKLIRTLLIHVSIALLGSSFLLSAPSALAQVAGLVQVTPLQAAETGGCFVGTTGADATLFLRAQPSGVGCDTQDFNSNICVARSEFPADQPNGTIASFGDSSILRPSVSGDGSTAYFSRNIDLCVMPTNPIQQDICFNLPPSFFVHAATVSPAGNWVGLIPRDLNNINVPANAIQIFGAVFPTLPLLGTFQFFSPAIYPDSLDFMGKGEWVVFDASTSPFIGGTWGIYVLNLNTGERRTLISPIAGYELRNPAFAQTSDQVIAFDAFEIATGLNTVLTANIVTGDVREIAQTNVFGIPGFTGDDSAVIFNREDASTLSTISMRRRAVAADRITPVGAEQSWITDGGFAAVYRRGVYDTSTVPCNPVIPGIVPGGTLQLNRGTTLGTGVTIDLTWDASCSSGATNYTIHEGQIGDWYSHTAVVCSESDTQLTGYNPSAGDRYFLVVPTTGDTEGSYGTDSDGNPRPVSSTTCFPNQIVDTCP